MCKKIQLVQISKWQFHNDDDTTGRTYVISDVQQDSRKLLDNQSAGTQQPDLTHLNNIDTQLSLNWW